MGVLKLSPLLSPCKHHKQNAALQEKNYNCVCFMCPVLINRPSASFNPSTIQTISIILGIGGNFTFVRVNSILI
jgi:hypothetical protein